MIRRWFRALVRTCVSGQPYRTPPNCRRGPRILLRLELVEDRTVASSTHGDLLSSKAPESVQATAAPLSSDHRSHVDGNGSDKSSDIGSAEVTHPIGLFEAAATDFQNGDPASPNTAASADMAVPQLKAELSDQPAVTSARIDEGPSRSTTVTTGLPSEEPPPSEVTAPHEVSAANADRQPVASTPTAASSETAKAQAAIAPSVGNSSRTNLPRDSTPANGSPARVLASDAIATATPRSRGTNSATPKLERLAQMSDGTLLSRFVTQREQAAFTALVQRHGPLVLGVCQRLLGDYHAAQDASQTTFLILARKAGLLDRNGSLGGWLYRVAYHVALRSRGVAARQRELEAGSDEATNSVADNTDRLEQQELRQALREELQQLPEKYRTPLTLCYVDGQSHSEAAVQIGMPRGSIAKRVGEGLDRLRDRLLTRGFVM